jgi:hypothetical protein
MVELVELFVVIAATVDQDVVLPVMQAMCSTAAIVVHFLSYATLCIGCVVELFRLLILQLPHPVPQLLHHLIQLLILLLTHHPVLHPLRLHPMVKGHVHRIQRQTRIMVRSTILSVPSLHALVTPSP